MREYLGYLEIWTLKKMLSESLCRFDEFSKKIYACIIIEVDYFDKVTAEIIFHKSIVNGKLNQMFCPNFLGIISIFQTYLFEY